MTKTEVSESQVIGRSSNRREYLARAAIVLFVNKGFLETKARDIVKLANSLAKQAGERPIAESSFYQFFANREALAEHIALVEKQKLLAVMEQEIGGADIASPPHKIYLKAHEAIKDLYLREPALAAILYEVRGIADTIRDTQEPIAEEMLNKVLQLLKRRGAIPNMAQQYVFSTVFLQVLDMMHRLAVSVIVTPDNALETIIDESLWAETDKLVLPYLKQYGLL